MNAEHIIPPEWRPGFLLEWADGGNDGCENNDRIKTHKEPGILPLSVIDAEASADDPGMDEGLSTQASSSNDELHKGREPFTFEIEFQRLEEYKEVYDTVDVLPAHCHDGRFQGLTSFLNYWRSVAKCYDLGEAKRSTGAKANISRLINFGIDMETTDTRLLPSLTFERDFQHLKEYKDIHGTADLLAKHCREEKFRGLKRFLREWRSKARYFDQPDASKANKILQLMALGVDMERPAAPRMPFESNCMLLKEYKEVHGTINVLAKHCQKGKFQGLDFFLIHWRCNARHSHQPDSSTAKKIRQLVDLGVDMGFQPRPGFYLPSISDVDGV